MELKTDETPVVVERIMRDIDDIVRLVRFPDWQTTAAGKREIRRLLHKSFLKYQMNKNKVLFQGAYEYTKEYY